MKYVEKTCPVCGGKFILDAKVGHEELGCTLGCCLKIREKKCERKEALAI